MTINKKIAAKAQYRPLNQSGSPGSVLLRPVSSNALLPSLSSRSIVKKTKNVNKIPSTVSQVAAAASRRQRIRSCQGCPLNCN